MSAWAHLPNAPHIDRILEHTAKKPTRWSAVQGAALDVARGAARDIARDVARHAARGIAWSAGWNAARDITRDTTRNAARDTTWDTTWDTVRSATWDTARSATWDAIAALIAWDDCAYLLDLTPETVRGIVRISNSPAAILLLPAVTALQSEGV